MKIHKEGSGSYHFSWYMTTVYAFNIRYISMHRPYNHTWPHMVSLLFVADMHINLLYLDVPFFTAIAVFGRDTFYEADIYLAMSNQEYNTV